MICPCCHSAITTLCVTCERESDLSRLEVHELRTQLATAEATLAAIQADCIMAVAACRMPHSATVEGIGQQASKTLEMLRPRRDGYASRATTEAPLVGVETRTK